MSVFFKTIGSKAVGLSKSIQETFSENFRTTAKKTASIGQSLLIATSETSDKIFKVRGHNIPPVASNARGLAYNKARNEAKKLSIIGRGKSYARELKDITASQALGVETLSPNEKKQAYKEIGSTIRWADAVLNAQTDLQDIKLLISAA